MAVCAVSPAACDRVSARRSSKQGGLVSASHVFLRANVRKELGKAGLCVQARCEKEGARAIMILTELGVCAALLKEERQPNGRHLV